MTANIINAIWFLGLGFILGRWFFPYDHRTYYKPVKYPKCKCGTEIFLKNGYAYNVDYTRDFPDRPPLLHGCEFQERNERYIKAEK